MLFSIVAAPVHIPTNSAPGSSFSSWSPALALSSSLSLFNSSCCNGPKVVSHSVLVGISLMISEDEHLWKNVSSSPLPIFHEVFLLLSCRSSLYFWICTPTMCRVFSHSAGCPLLWPAASFDARTFCLPWSDRSELTSVACRMAGWEAWPFPCVCSGSRGQSCRCLPGRAEQVSVAQEGNQGARTVTLE